MAAHSGTGTCPLARSSRLTGARSNKPVSDPTEALPELCWACASRRFRQSKLAAESAELLQAGRHTAIVDEVDAALIDHGRMSIPLGGQSAPDVGMYAAMAQLAGMLEGGVHYGLDLCANTSDASCDTVRCAIAAIDAQISVRLGKGSTCRPT
jgi:hypothetical protein